MKSAHRDFVPRNRRFGGFLPDPSCENEPACRHPAALNLFYHIAQIRTVSYSAKQCHIFNNHRRSPAKPKFEIDCETSGRSFQNILLKTFFAAEPFGSESGRAELWVRSTSLSVPLPVPLSVSYSFSLSFSLSVPLSL